MYAYPAHECKVEIDNEAAHIVSIINMTICAFLPGDLACWPTLAVHVHNLGVNQLPPINKQLTHRQSTCQPQLIDMNRTAQVWKNCGSEALTANVLVLFVAADLRPHHLCQCHVSIITNRHVLQGSIQATLAAAPLELAYVYKSGAHHYTAWAEAITVVGVFSILIGATIAWLSAAFLGPALLTKVCVIGGLSSCMQLYGQH